MTKTTIITTQVHCDSDDFDIRREFCGFQDKRLNELRQFTSCIIDLQTHGIKDPFEKVTWIISHYDSAVRAFVAKRIQAWAKTTEIAAQIHAEDIAFHQQNLSDVSSCSTDHKAQHLGNSAKSSPSPSTSSNSMKFNKRSQTPLHDHHFQSIRNAALVPQTDVQSRHQPRYRRNSSSSSSNVERPALFGKPSDSFFSRATNNYPRSRYSPLSTPASKPKANDDDFASIRGPISYIDNEESFDITKLQDTELDPNAHEEENNLDLEEEAKWANLLSDISDFESNSHPLMADIILVSRLREWFLNSHITFNDSIEHIQSILPSNLVITSIERLKTLNNKPIWFHRLILDSRIILSNGIHSSRSKAQKLAYKKMIELITNKQGVEAKIISNGRCKVVLRKVLPAKQLNETTLNESRMNVRTEAY